MTTYDFDSCREPIAAYYDPVCSVKNYVRVSAGVLTPLCCKKGKM